MGMQASVLAIGPFSPEVADCLEYSAKYYEETRPGTTVITELFGLYGGTNGSAALAEHLGVSKPWDFNQHKLDPKKLDVSGLKSLFATWECGEDCLVDLDKMLKLRDHGFQFFFRPHG